MRAAPLALSLLLAATLAPIHSPAQSPIPSPEMHWRSIGPFRGGRTRAATGVPGQPNLFYIGQVDGGVFRSTDYGRTWAPIFDSQPSQSIGAIAVAPSNPSVLYVASGEGLRRPDLSVGDGIYRSADAGRTWSHLGLRDGQQIPALAIDPRDPNTLFAAVLGHPYGPNEERGIFKSTDGGTTWTKVLYKDPNTGGDDVVLDPADPNTVYATLWESRLGPWEDGNSYEGTHGGIFKSTDGGTTWSPLTKGLPDNLVQAHIAVSPSDPHRLYASIATAKQGGYASGAGLGIYRSDDSGASWYKVTDDPRPAMKIGGGDLSEPVVDPKNPDVVYVASIVTVRSLDGGHTWSSLRGAPGGDDYQNLWINPTNPDIILLVSDQGAIISTNRGETWGSWYNQPTAQLYHVAATAEFPYKLCAGQQESGSVCIASRGNDGYIDYRDWHPAGIIEYGYAAPDPLHPEIVFGAGRTSVSRYNSITGQVQDITPVPLRNPEIRADRTEPIAFSPLDPHLLFAATSVLFETRDSGATWTRISPDLSREHSGQPSSLPALPQPDQARRRGAIYSLAPSFKSLATLWAGTDDGLLWITHDHGKNWKNITPPSLTPWSKITQIAASHFDDTTAFVSISRLRVDDLHPYILRTRDSGATWQPITTGLPEDSPVNTVREDPLRKGLLFAGTETAVWYSLDSGAHWLPLQLNLPHTSMRDLAIVHTDLADDLVLATHGRGFWVLDSIASLRQQADLNPDTPTLFTPSTAVRARRSTYTDTPMPPDEPHGENPPDGAILDYSLPTNITGEVSLEILDSTNQLIRRYSSLDAPYATPDQLAAQLIPLYWIKLPQALPATPGLHRWVWDLRAATPTATSYEYPISAVPHRTPRTPQGPLVLPGTYTVRLTAAGKTRTTTLTVKMDPRVKATPADLLALHTAETRLAALVTSTSAAALEAHSLREQIARLARTAAAPLKSSLEASAKQLSEIIEGTPAAVPPAAPTPGKSEGTRPPKSPEQVPGLDDISGESSALYTQIGQSDAAPTAAQLRATAHAAEESEDSLRAWNRWRSTALPTLNQQLHAAHLDPLNPARQPSSMPQSGDED